MFDQAFGVGSSALATVVGRFGRHGAVSARAGKFGPGFIGGGGIPGGRRLASSDLQLLILSLLAEAPAHGYEIIRTLEERSEGFYTPSPGMVYPALTRVQEAGQASVEAAANRKLYSITEAGRNFFEANRERATTILETLKRIGGRMAEVREAYAGIDDLDPQSADELSQARYGLKRALMSKRGSGPDVVYRIARILKNAANEISKL